MTGMMPDLRWTWQRFDELTVPTLYELLRLRAEVFVVEQQCAFQDLDGSDAQAWHLLGHGTDGTLLAYARCFGPGLQFDEASIGRVITAAPARGTGLGHHLMREAVQRLWASIGPQPIRIGAQERLVAFYEQHGFTRASDAYIEDGIPHVEMLRHP